MNVLIDERRTNVKTGLQRVIWCGAYQSPLSSKDPKEGFSPSAVAINDTCRGANNALYDWTVTLGCIMDETRWEVWKSFRIETATPNPTARENVQMMSQQVSSREQPSWASLFMTMGRGGLQYVFGLESEAVFDASKVTVTTPVPNVWSMPTCNVAVAQSYVTKGMQEIQSDIGKEVTLGAAFATLGAGMTAAIFLTGGAFPFAFPVGVGAYAFRKKHNDGVNATTTAGKAAVAASIGGSAVGLTSLLSYATGIGAATTAAGAATGAATAASAATGAATAVAATGGLAVVGALMYGIYKNWDSIKSTMSGTESQEKEAEGTIDMNNLTIWQYLVLGNDGKNVNLYLRLAELERQHMLSVNHKHTKGLAPPFENPQIETQTFVELLIMVTYLYGSAIDDIGQIQDILRVLNNGVQKRHTTQPDLQNATGSHSSLVEQLAEKLNAEEPTPTMTGFPIDDAVMGNYIFTWDKFSPVSFFAEDIRDAINKDSKKGGSETLQNLITKMAVYGRLVLIVGVVYAEFANLKGAGGGPSKLDRKQMLEAAIVVSQIQNINSADLRNLTIGTDSDRFLNVVCHEFFDPQHVMFQDPDIIPYNLIYNHNSANTPHQDTENRAKLQQFVNPLVEALYKARPRTWK